VLNKNESMLHEMNQKKFKVTGQLGGKIFDEAAGMRLDEIIKYFIAHSNKSDLRTEIDIED
jgi:hypothetical protein